MILVVGSAGLIGHSVSKFLKKKEKVFELMVTKEKNFLEKSSILKNILEFKKLKISLMHQ